MSAADTTPIIDIDSHISEPPDLWTSRVPKKWVDEVPQVRFNPELGVDDWFVKDLRLVSPGFLAMAGQDKYTPDFPAHYEEFDPAAWQPEARLARLDEFDVYAQVLFPNVLSFYAWAFMAMDDQEIAYECTRAYNDFAVEFASADSTRLLPLAVVPFWNIEESVKELRRAHSIGHRGLVFGWEYERIGLPLLTDKHWEPILKTAEELEMSINLHVAVSTRTEQDTTAINRERTNWDSALYAMQTALVMMSNTKAIALLTTSGILGRYPNLKWISVESGFGYIPFLLESLDWQWHNGGAIKDHPDMPLPSEAFKQSIYGSFWFEKDSLDLLHLYPDNMLFETDFPHPTSLSPGPASTADPARVQVKNAMGHLPDDVVRKVLFDNAASLFKVPKPAGYQG
jgi:predicted TIM-barrel fold metal-dependent hydrolase